MRVLIVPLAAAAIFATATYSSATTGGADDRNTLYAGAEYQLPVDMKIPALTAGVKVQMSGLTSQALALPQEVRILR